MIVSPDQITGLILAGGRGQRVAENDKGLLIYQGKPLIENQLNWFSSQVKYIMISANRNLKKYQSYHYPVYPDLLMDSEEEIFSGPLTGLLTCLKQSQTEWVFVQPVDMPLMPYDLIDTLCQSIKEKAPVYYLASSERSHYLSMLASKNVLPELEKYLDQGEKRVRGFLERVAALRVDLGFDEKYFSNLNELTDYQ